MRVPGGTIHGLVEKVARFFRLSRKANHRLGRNWKQSAGAKVYFRPVSLHSTTGEVSE